MPADGALTGYRYEGGFFKGRIGGNGAKTGGPATKLALGGVAQLAISAHQASVPMPM